MTFIHPLFFAYIAFLIMIIISFTMFTYKTVFGLEDPDFEIYTKNGAHWSEEIDYYGDQMNNTLILPQPQNNNSNPNQSGHLIPAPCCRQFD